MRDLNLQTKRILREHKQILRANKHPLNKTALPHLHRLQPPEPPNQLELYSLQLLRRGIPMLDPMIAKEEQAQLLQKVHHLMQEPPPIAIRFLTVGEDGPTNLISDLKATNDPMIAVNLLMDSLRGHMMDKGMYDPVSKTRIPRGAKVEIQDPQQSVTGTGGHF